MNRIIIVICIVVSLFLINIGLSINSHIDGLTKKTRDIQIQNNLIKEEILNRQILPQRPPMLISNAFSIVINEIYYLEEFSGTAMKLIIEKSNDNEDITKHYINSEYRGIKKLPVLLRIDKFSNETDMGEVLNDIYQLEVMTDFKVNEIIKEGNTLNVKGDVYGF